MVPTGEAIPHKLPGDPSSEDLCKELTVLLKIDNTTAVTYINRLGGPVSLLATEITKELWLWCLQRNITLKAQHLTI